MHDRIKRALHWWWTAVEIYGALSMPRADAYGAILAEEAKHGHR